jgi:predicted dehydrogenase
MVRFDNGAVMHVEASFAAHIEQDVYNLQVLGERGGAESAGGKVFTDQHGYMMTSTPAHLPEAHPFEYKMKHFVEVSRGQRYNEVPPEAGVMVQKMLEAMYASAASGGEQKIQ